MYQQPPVTTPSPTRRSSDLIRERVSRHTVAGGPASIWRYRELLPTPAGNPVDLGTGFTPLVEAKNLGKAMGRSEEHTSELQSHSDFVCRLLLEKKKEYYSCI